MSIGYVTLAGGFTLGAWVWRDTAPTSTEYLFSQTHRSPTGGSNSSQVYLGLGSGNGLRFRARTDTGSSRVLFVDEEFTDWTSDGEWHHVALRCTPTSTANRYSWGAFLDGERIFEGTDDGTVIWPAGRLSIGARYAPSWSQFGDNFWNGKVAYATVNNVALSGNRIREHYTAGKGNSVFYGDDEVTRLNRIYTGAGVPVQSRQLDKPVTALFGTRFADAVALDLAQDAAGNASGYVFADGQGRMVYHNRRRRNNRFVSAILTEHLSASPEVGLVFTSDDAQVVNDVKGRRMYGGTWRLRDRESEGVYGRKTATLELAVISMEEVRNAVSWALARYGRDRLRVSQVRLRAESSDLLEWVTTGGVEVGDVITLADLPEESPSSSLDFVVEGMRIDADFVDGRWEMELDLSPHEINKVFQLGRSELGEDVVAY